MTAQTINEADTPSLLKLYYHGQEIPGWVPITHMVDLAARLMGATLCTTGDAQVSRRALIPRYLRHAPRGDQQGAIYIARNPSEVRAFLSLPSFSEPCRFRAVWIIDSFRTEELPQARLLSNFDVVAYSQAYDRDVYEAAVGHRALLLPWGTDALGLGSRTIERPYDVLRLGRQPKAWDDDVLTQEACALRGLRFRGRPPYTDFAQMQQTLIQNWYAKTKFIIAHSNLAAPAPYTHQSKEYITARWTDALAAGAVVAGVQPHSDLELLNWPEATLDFSRIDLAHNVDLLAEAAADWTPDIPRRNHLAALEHLDWRWRFKTMCDRLGITAPELEQDLTALRARIAHLRTPY